MDSHAGKGSFNNHPLQLLKNLKEDMNNIAVMWPFRDYYVKRLQFPLYVDGFKIQIGQSIKSVHSSKFCSGSLLRIHNQVCEVARRDFYFSPSMQGDEVVAQQLEQEREIYHKLKKEYPMRKLTILNFKKKLWNLMEGGNHEAEINAFRAIVDASNKMWRDENLVLLGYPMLTQFNVGTVYMLCHLFDAVDFVKQMKQELALIFTGFRHWNPKMHRFLEEVGDTNQKLHSEGGNRTVRSLFPINKLCGCYSSLSKAEGQSSGQLGKCDDIFYQCVRDVNNLCVKEQASDIIASILEQYKNSSM